MRSLDERPCWREATTPAWLHAPEHLYRAEHARSLETRFKREELLRHLDMLGEWIARWNDPRVGETRLQYQAFTTGAGEVGSGGSRASHLVTSA